MKKLLFVIAILGSFVIFLPSPAAAQNTSTMCQQAYDRCVSVTGLYLLCGAERDRCNSAGTIPGGGGGGGGGGGTTPPSGGGGSSLPPGSLAGGTLINSGGPLTIGECNYYYLDLMNDPWGWYSCAMASIIL